MPIHNLLIYKGKKKGQNLALIPMITSLIEQTVGVQLDGKSHVPSTCLLIGGEWFWRGNV